MGWGCWFIKDAIVCIMYVFNTIEKEIYLNKSVYKYKDVHTKGMPL